MATPTKLVVIVPVSVDLVLLERTCAAEVRNMLRTMLADSERRQSLIQELIQSNSKLK